MRTDALLSKESVTNTPTLEFITKKFQRVQLDHTNSYIGSYMHPVENLDGYGGDITLTTGNALLRLSLNNTLEEKMPLLL